MKRQTFLKTIALGVIAMFVPLPKQKPGSDKPITRYGDLSGIKLRAGEKIGNGDFIIIKNGKAYRSQKDDRVIGFAIEDANKNDVFEIQAID